MNNFKKVILVDEQDNPIGEEEKLKAHIDGKLHRAFSIFLFNEKNEMLLQQRALNKYHSAGLWTNTCCSHPQPNSNINSDIRDRLLFEMGIICKLSWQFSFKYKASFYNGITEHELDHVYTGIFNKNPNPNPDEVADWRWINIIDLKIDIEQNPQKYTEWFKVAFPIIVKDMELRNLNKITIRKKRVEMTSTNISIKIKP